MAATFFAAIESSNVTGTVYGIGPTEADALHDALSAGDPCVTHEDAKPGHSAADHFAIVPCTEAASIYVAEQGGAPSRDLIVTARGVSLRSEEE
jgi:hypothetical protein